MIVYLTETVAPVVQAVSWSTHMKRQLRLRTDEEQTFVEVFIDAATKWVEGEINRIIRPSTWQVAFDKVPCNRELPLPGGPARSLSSVEYMNTSNVATTYSGDVQEILQATPAFVRLTDDDANFPPDTSDDSPWVIRATYETGYANQAAVPSALVAAIMLRAEELYLGEDGKFDAQISILTRPYWVPRLVVLHTAEDPAYTTPLELL